MKNDDLLIRRVCDGIQKISRATRGMDQTAFLQNEVVAAATMLWLIQIGETAKRLSKETTAKYEVPWKDIAGFRDMAVHDYFEMSLREVWKTVEEDMPQLAQALSCPSIP